MSKPNPRRRKISEEEIDRAVLEFENTTGIDFDDVGQSDYLLDVLASYAAGTDADVIHEHVDPQLMDRSRAA